MSSYYLNKKLCCDMGRGLLNTGQVTGMTYLQIAKEIYAHAVCYYIYENNSYLKHNLLAKYLHDKGADGIAIENEEIQQHVRFSTLLSGKIVNEIVTHIPHI